MKKSFEEKSIRELRTEHKELVKEQAISLGHNIEHGVENHFDEAYKELVKIGVNKDFNITYSTNPYRAKIQKTANMLLNICIAVKVLILILICLNSAALIFSHFSTLMPLASKFYDINILSHGMQDFSKIPFIEKYIPNAQIMLSQFIMIVSLSAMLWIIRIVYGMLLNVSTHGDPFTNASVTNIRKMCFPALLLCFWNIPISIFFIAFILFLSIIFEYGVYLQDENEKTNSLQEDVILSFAEITEAKSGQTGQHVKRVSEYTRFLSLQMGLSLEESENLRIASMMHDVGKLLIPSSILDKPGKLTDEEFAIIKNHTIYGDQLLENANGEIMHLARTVAREHHEKWDGNGYAHIKGEDISLAGRIVAVADVYDALTSRRSYKNAWDEQDAYDEIVKCSGSHFDPSVVEAFISCYPKILDVRQKYADA